MLIGKAYGSLVRPELAELLEFLHLDTVFERASGCTLWPQGSAEPVLDLVGGFGSLLFGHNHPELVRAAVSFLEQARPIHVQGALRSATGELARRLSQGRYHVLFANSGAEAVEAALKHVRMEREGPIVALEGAFHGKTLGALQLTANTAYRERFELGLDVIRIPPNDTEALRRAFERKPAALFLELVQGEGGIIPLTPEFVRLARELSTDAALVVDEIQTGLGRTGKFLACEHYDLQPDTILLSKSLGGGIAKISAVLIRQERYRRPFALLHTSTFADDDFSSTIALRFLDLVGPETLEEVTRKGDWLKGELLRLRDEFPEVIRDVRGLGLMLGIEFHPARSGFLLPMLGDDLALVLAGYLFHEHRIRIAPTLSRPLTLRVQPPVITPPGELKRFVEALGDACRKIRDGDALGLTRYFLPARPSDSEELPAGFFSFARVRETGVPVSETAAPRVGWVFHLNDADDLVSLEPTFARLSAQEREEYLRHVERQARPAVMDSVEITSQTGQKAHFHAILLPITARRIRELLDRGETRWLRALVERGIDVAEELGSSVVSLGHYTSIIMQNGLAARHRKIGITTGNAYAVALALEAIERAVPDLSRSTVAVVGATGNIGAVLGRVVAERCARTILIGRSGNGAISRMKRFALPNAVLSTNLSDARQAQVVLVSVSSAEPVLTAEHLSEDALVCDLSVPGGVDLDGRQDVRLLYGGVLRMPNREEHGIAGFPLDPGLWYGCMAEAILLGLEGRCDRTFTGPLSADHVRTIASVARKHGFRLAEFKTRQLAYA